MSAAVVEPGTPGSVKYTVVRASQDGLPIWIVCSRWQIVCRLWADTLGTQGRFLEPDQRLAVEAISAYLQEHRITETVDLAIEVSREAALVA